MTITPVELHHIRLKRGLLGYRRGPVDELILEIADSFEEVWRQRADYADRIEHLEGELSRHRDLESLLRTTLVSQGPGEARGGAGGRRGPCRGAGGHAGGCGGAGTAAR